MNEIILKNANLFFSDRQEVQERQHQTTPKSQKTIWQLIEQTPAIPKESVDQYLSGGKGIDSNSETLLTIRKSLHKIRNTINQFTPEKRFFITETIDFLNSPTQAGKVIPALLNLDRSEYRYQLLHFIYSTFARLNNNVETIISTPELFTEESLHVERGGLYSLSMDVARSVSGLFAEEFLSKFAESGSEVARVKEIFGSYTIKGKGRSVAALHQLSEGFISQPQLLRDSILEFVSRIQTHSLLYLYARKRHAYYKRFMMSVTVGTKISDPFASSLVLAGCLLTNRQLAPNQALISALADSSKFQLPETNEALGLFADQLTPSTQYDIINDFKQSATNVVTGKKLKLERKKGEEDRSGFKLTKVKDLIKQRLKT